MHELLLDNTAGLWLTRTLIKDSLRVLNTPLSLMTHLKNTLNLYNCSISSYYIPFLSSEGFHEGKRISYLIQFALLR